MSRVGNKPINLPKGVEIKVQNNNLVEVKGPKGKISQQFSPDLKIDVEGNLITVKRPTEQKRHKALHGLTRALISNMVIGTSEGFKEVLELRGVGFRAATTGQLLELSVGFSHPVVVLVPEEIKISALMEKGKNPIVTLEGYDKELVGLVASKIRGIRKPEPYKGKGIRYVDEYVRKKAGKTAAK